MRHEKSPPWRGRPMDVVGFGLANALTGAGVDADALNAAVSDDGTGAGIAANPTGMTTPVTMATAAVVMPAVAVTAMAMTGVMTMAVVTLVHRALDDATEDTANDTTHEGFSGGGASGSLLDDNRLAVGDRNDLRGGWSDGLNARDTGDFKAGHVNGGLVDEGAGLTGEAVVIEGGSFGCGAGDDEGGTGEGSSGHTREGVAQERGGGHGRRL